MWPHRSQKKSIIFVAIVRCHWYLLDVIIRRVQQFHIVYHIVHLALYLEKSVRPPILFRFFSVALLQFYFILLKWFTFVGVGRFRCTFQSLKKKALNSRETSIEKYLFFHRFLSLFSIWLVGFFLFNFHAIFFTFLF